MNAAPRRPVSFANLVFQLMKILLKIGLLSLSAAALPALAAAADAQENWTKQCAKCHGADGSGNTAMGKKLKLKDYTSAAVQAELTDEAMTTAIKDGVKNEAGKMVMPAYADKLQDADVAALVALIRSMKKG